jgi:hypothetical protein
MRRLVPPERSLLVADESLHHDRTRVARYRASVGGYLRSLARIRAEESRERRRVAGYPTKKADDRALVARDRGLVTPDQPEVRRDPAEVAPYLTKVTHDSAEVRRDPARVPGERASLVRYPSKVAGYRASVAPPPPLGKKTPRVRFLGRGRRIAIRRRTVSLGGRRTKARSARSIVLRAARPELSSPPVSPGSVRPLRESPSFWDAARERGQPLT